MYARDSIRIIYIRCVSLIVVYYTSKYYGVIAGSTDIILVNVVIARSRKIFLRAIPRNIAGENEILLLCALQAWWKTGTKYWSCMCRGRVIQNTPSVILFLRKDISSGEEHWTK